MPTAGRLAGALAFLIYGWYIGGRLVPFFPEGKPPGFLMPLCIVLGIICGWKIVGARANKGYQAAIGHGLTGAAAFSFWIVFLVSLNQMIGKAMRRFYDGPMEGVVDIFALMVELGKDLLDLNLILSVAIGGIIAAWIAEYFAKRYP